MSQYTAVADRTLVAITKKGAAVIFTPVGGPELYNPLTGEWSSGSGTAFTGRAVQIPDDPTQFAALNLILVSPITLLVAAKNLGGTPAPGMTLTWAGQNYTVKNVETTAPDGTTPILHEVIGGR